MPYMWLKEDEADLIRRRRRKDIPEHIAYYDFDKGAYYCEDCHTYNLAEIGGLPSLNNITYTPILQCQECGVTYFGLDTRIPYEPEAPAPMKEQPAVKEEQSPTQEEEYIILPSIMTV